jgi:hypothetical protein
MHIKNAILQSSMGDMMLAATLSRCATRTGAASITMLEKMEAGGRVLELGDTQLRPIAQGGKPRETCSPLQQVKVF